MATPKIVTDSSTKLTAANLNKFFSSSQDEGVIRQHKMMWAVPQYNGSAWAIFGSDSNSIAAGDLSWSTTGVNHLNVTLSDFGASKKPLVVGMPFGTTTRSYMPFIDQNSTSLAGIYFVDDSGDTITTEDTNMKLGSWVIGEGGSKTVTDNTDNWSEAVLNKYISCAQDDGDKVGAKIVYGKIKYDGSSWVVDTGSYSAGLADADLAWTTDRLVITLSGFTNNPIAIASPTTSATDPETSNIVQVNTGANSVSVYFYNFAGTNITTEATTMNFSILIMGT